MIKIITSSSSGISGDADMMKNLRAGKDRWEKLGPSKSRCQSQSSSDIFDDGAGLRSRAPLRVPSSPEINTEHWSVDLFSFRQFGSKVTKFQNLTMNQNAAKVTKKEL